ncbi:hypothetical protein, partial [Xanthomonas phaseoli]|uniref:hypothetical protein n=1 Tax=Xanthomonas phaseoli TaxID=1985254 RepID=UPI001ED96DE1
YTNPCRPHSSSSAAEISRASRSAQSLALTAGLCKYPINIFCTQISNLIFLTQNTKAPER